METSLVPGGGGAPVAAAAVVAPAAVPAAVRSTSTVCGYCDCTLAADGGVLRISDRVKALNRQEERIDNLKAECARLEATIAQLEADNAALRAAQAAATSRKLTW